MYTCMSTENEGAVHRRSVTTNLLQSDVHYIAERTQVFQSSRKGKYINNVGDQSGRSQNSCSH